MERENLATDKPAHSPTPWVACHDGRCPCAAIWSETADHPVAEVTRGDWGDSFPNIRLRKDESGMGYVAEAFNERIDYGSVAPEIATANAEFIVRACNAHDELVRRAADVLEGLEGVSIGGAMPVRIEKLRAILEAVSP